MSQTVKAQISDKIYISVAGMYKCSIYQVYYKAQGYTGQLHS